MRIVLQINQGVRKVILRNPNCESFYMYALNVIPVGEQFSFSWVANVMTYSNSSIIFSLLFW